MGIIRPTQPNDGAGRWAITIDPAGDDHLIGTRAGVLAASELLHAAGVGHAVYRRPGTDADWQLIQGPADMPAGT